MTEADATITEVQYEEIRRGDLIRVTEAVGDAAVTRAGRAHRLKHGVWETEDGVTLLPPAVDPRALNRKIELVERPAAVGLPQDPGEVIIATLVNGIEGRFPLFRGRAAWHSGQEIANGWLFNDSEIQAWHPAAIVEEVIPTTADTNGAEL
jgi:hypothetical protein